MKKSLLLIMSVLLIAGCEKKERVEEVPMSTSIPTSDKAVFESENIEELEEEITTTLPIATTTTTTTTKKTTSKTTKQTTKTVTTAKTTTKQPTTTKKLTEAEVRSAIESLKSKYPTGTPWDNSNSYKWKGGMYSIGYGCAGFAFLLSDVAFGETKAKKHTNFDNIRVGDIVRYLDDGHSVIVLEVKQSSIIVAEGNMNSAVMWGREIPMSDIKQSGTYVLTRW